MITLKDYKKEYDAIYTKKNLTGKNAINAVKRDGCALRYVKEQTEAICLAAVKQNKDTLQFVENQFFTT